MECREKHKKPGDVFPVRDGFHYALPPGLKDGTPVTLLSFDHGYWTVESAGKQYIVFSGRVDAGMEYRLDGRWLPADDPLVIVRKKEITLMNSPAFSCVAGGCVNRVNPPIRPM